MVTQDDDDHFLFRVSFLVIDKPYSEVAERDFVGNVVEVDSPFGEYLFGFFLVPLNNIYNIYTL